MSLQLDTLLEKILSTTQTAIFWKDKDRRFLGANKAFLDYYGFPSVDSILGKTDEEMGWHEENEPYKNDEISVLQTGKSTRRVLGRCMCRGEMRDIVASKSPMYENGEIIGLVGTFEDVTEALASHRKIKQLNRQLRVAAKKAQAADNAKPEFLSNVSHDMRTPLNGILGFAELALLTDDPGLQRSYLEKIAASGRLLRKLIDDTLELSHIASGQTEAHVADVDVSALLGDLITTIEPLAHSKQLEFHVDNQLQETHMIRTDPVLLSKILLNLLSNAVKFTPAGGKVEFQITSHDAYRQNDLAHYCFVVRDNGIGMSEEFQRKMYEPFTQEMDSAIPLSEGTGLGLTITRQAVELLGGNLSVESQKGHGTFFTLELTLRAAEQKDTSTPEAYLSAQALQDAKLLLCEDNPLNQEIAKSLLEMNGMQVICAADGEEGLRVVQVSDLYGLDLILMDIRMPGMNGLVASKAIRALNRPDTKKIPIVALSANAFQEDIAESRAAGMNAHLTKPFQIERLLSCITPLIENYRKEKESVQ